MKSHILTRTILVVLSFISASSLAYSQNPPYSGTIFLDPDIIVNTDPSALESVSYAGRGNRVVFDRRTNSWETINAYLFSIIFNDGLVSEGIINPEFDNEANATTEAEKYAFLVGQLPYCLREDIEGIWVHKGVQPFGGGNNSILIHMGQTPIYERDGILEETLIHEAAHTSLDASHATASSWINAQNLDGNFISTYARDNGTREDIAESFLPWLMVRYRSEKISSNTANTITQTIPARLAYFDDQNFDLRPFNGVVAGEKKKEETSLEVFPNPTTGSITLSNLNNKYEYLKVTNIQGEIISESTTLLTEQISLKIADEPGLYLIELTALNGEREMLKVVKK